MSPVAGFAAIFKALAADRLKTEPDMAQTIQAIHTSRTC
jgi:hypothetical protein